MVLAVYRPKPCRCDVGVELRGADVGVTQQGLDDAQVRPAAEEMRREGMP